MLCCTALAQSNSQYRCALLTGEIFLTLQQRHLHWGLRKDLRGLGAQIPLQLRWNWGPCCLWFCCIKWYMHECILLMSPAIMCPQISDNTWNSALTSSWSRAFLLQWILLMHSAWHKSSVGPLHCFFSLIFFSVDMCEWGGETGRLKDSGRAGNGQSIDQTKRDSAKQIWEGQGKAWFWSQVNEHFIMVIYVSSASNCLTYSKGKAEAGGQSMERMWLREVKCCVHGVVWCPSLPGPSCQVHVLRLTFSYNRAEQCLGHSISTLWLQIL